MNDIFSFSRFAKLVRFECRNYLPDYLGWTIVGLELNVYLWLVTWVFNLPQQGRVWLISICFYILSALSPFFVYGKFNHRKDGVPYVMLPASRIEKYLSMMLISFVIVPAAVYAMLTLTDALLYILSSIGLGRYTGIVFFNPFTYAPFWMYEILLPQKIIFLSLLAVSFSMLMNILFRSYKIVKSVVVLMVLNSCTMVLAVLFPMLIVIISVFLFPMPYEENTTYHIINCVLVAGFDMFILIVWHVITYIYYRRIQY